MEDIEYVNPYYVLDKFGQFPTNIEGGLLPDYSIQRVDMKNKTISREALLEEGWRFSHSNLEEGKLTSVVYVRKHPTTPRKRFVLKLLVKEEMYVFEIFIPGLIRRKKIYTGYPSTMSDLHSMYEYN